MGKFDTQLYITALDKWSDLNGLRYYLSRYLTVKYTVKGKPYLSHSIYDIDSSLLHQYRYFH